MEKLPQSCAAQLGHTRLPCWRCWSITGSSARRRCCNGRNTQLFKRSDRSRWKSCLRVAPHNWATRACHAGDAGRLRDHQRGGDAAMAGILSYSSGPIGVDGKVASELRRTIGPHAPAMLEMLVDYGIISEAEMLQWQEYSVIQAVSRAVRWQQGRFEFHRNVLQGVQLALNVDHVLLESLRQADEWDEAASAGLNRSTVARWMPHFTGNIMSLGLEPDEVNVLCLANGQLSLQAIAYGLRSSEARIAQCMDHLLQLQLI